MANTTNFGWETPDDTDLVKDGASAMRTLGNAIDASFVDLKGGTTGQVLAKASNTDLDFTWSSVDPLTILDAKGDLITATAADTPARLAVGANGTYLQADSSTATGLKWGTVSAGGMTEIATINASGNTSVDFTSIPSTYKHLLLVWNGVYQSAGSTYYFVRFNGDSGGNYASIYARNNTSSVWGVTDGANQGGIGDDRSNAPILHTNTSSVNADDCRGFMWIYNYAQSSKPINVSYHTVVRNSSFVGISITNSVYYGYQAVNQVTFNRSSTQTVTGQFKLYGVS